jgi:uncharacterized protein
MRLSRSLIAILLLGWVLAMPRLGLGQGTSPYTVVVPVPDVSEAQRTQAFSTALAQVLARVSGGQDLSGKSGYAEALQNASGIVQRYQYQRTSGTPPSMSLEVAFDQGAVQRVVSQMGATPAGVKPPLLLVVRGTDGNVLTKDDLDALTDSAHKRGYQVAYADPSQLPDIGKLTEADPAALAGITRIYHTGLVLVGDVQTNGASWTLISGGQAQHWSVQGTHEDDMFTQAGNTAADHLGQALNVIGTSQVDGKLWVSGLQSAMDYANLLSTLRADPSVHKVSTLGAQDDGVLLDVTTDLPLDALASNLAAAGRVIKDKAHDGADASLRWLH